MYENVKAEDCLNTANEVETKVHVKEINKFIENHQQSNKDDGKEEEEEELPKKNVSANLQHTMMLYITLENLRNFHYITVILNFLTQSDRLEF
jgi:hypothetical protein